MSNIRVVLSTVNNRRNNFEYFEHEVFLSAFKTMDEVGVSVTMPRLAAKRIHRQNTDASIPHEYYWRVIYVPLLESIALDLRTRFNKSTFGKTS